MEYKVTLEAARVNAGLTQEDVRKKMGVSKVTVIEWEKGRKAPKPAEFYYLCNLYGVPMDCIFLPQNIT